MSTNYKKPVPKEVAEKAILSIINYCWDKEEQDYNDQPEDERVDHVFEDLQLARHWIHQKMGVVHTIGYTIPICGKCDDSMVFDKAEPDGEGDRLIVHYRCKECLP